MTDVDLEVLLEAPVQRRHETREPVLPPPLPMPLAPYRPVPTQRAQFESTSPQRYLESSSNIEVRPRFNISEVQIHQNRAWKDGRNEDPQILRPSHSYQPPEPPLMSGAIGPAPDRRSLEAHGIVQTVPRPRFTRPAPDSRMSNEGDFRQSLPQPHSNLLQYQQNPNELIRYLQTPAVRQLPSHAASRSSHARQSLIPPPSRGNIPGQGSDHLSNGEPRLASRHASMDGNFAPAASQQINCVSQPALESPFFKPYFNGPVPQQEPPMYQRSGTNQSEQIVSRLRHLKMESASHPPRRRPSLNALSFIDEPYTATNQSIYAQQRSPFSQIQEEQLYRPEVVSRAGFIQDSRVQQQSRRQPNSIRLPSYMPSSSQPLARSTKGARSGGSMVRPIGGQAVPPSTNSYAPGGGFFPRTNGGPASSRGLFSAAGRRSVRR